MAHVEVKTGTRWIPVGDPNPYCVEIWINGIRFEAAVADHAMALRLAAEMARALAPLLGFDNRQGEPW